MKLINKGITRKSAVFAINQAKDAGLLVEGLFMIGNMGETRETIEDTIQFATLIIPFLRMEKEQVSTGFSSPPPFRDRGFT